MADPNHDPNRHPVQEAPEESAPSEKPRPAWLASLVMYLLVPPGAYLLVLRTAWGDSDTALLTSALTLFLFWAAFSMANPRLIGLELIGVILATYYRVQPPMAVLWVTASAVAAATGVLLWHEQKSEQHYFFLVPASAALCFGFLVWLGSGARLEPSIARARREFKVERQQAIEWAKDLENRNLPEWGKAVREAAESPEPEFDIAVATSRLEMWILALWVFGRVSRRILGQFQNRRHSFVLFKIGHPYIFLLIIGLILEILNSLDPRWGMQWLAFPLLATFAVTCFFDGLAVVLFYGALQRFRGRRTAGFIWDMAGIMLVLTAWGVPAILIGLSDIWFDFRRLHGVRRRSDDKA